LAEGQFYSDLELTEKEIECMVMEASRAEYLSGNKSHQHITSTSGAEPSSSGSSKQSISWCRPSSFIPPSPEKKGKKRKEDLSCLAYDYQAFPTQPG